MSEETACRSCGGMTEMVAADAGYDWRACTLCGRGFMYASIADRPYVALSALTGNVGESSLDASTGHEGTTALRPS